MRSFALLTLIVLSATGCAGSNSQETEPTGTIAFVRKRDDESRAQVWVMRADGTGPAGNSGASDAAASAASVKSGSEALRCVATS
jgi:hypothetical protein